MRLTQKWGVRDLSDIYIRLSKPEALKQLEKLPGKHVVTFDNTGSVDFTVSVKTKEKEGEKRDKWEYFRVNAASSENGKEVTFIIRGIPPQKFPTIDKWEFQDLKDAIEANKKQEKFTLMVSVPPLFFLEHGKDGWELRRGLTLVFGATGSGKNHMADRLARGQMLKLDEADGKPGAEIITKEDHYLRFGDPIEGSLFPDNLVEPNREGAGTFKGGVGDHLLETNRYRPDDLQNVSSFVADALRQKADVVTISELRKKEDFCDALVLAATDHRVVATGHAKDMDSAILRLFEMSDCLEPSAKRTPLVSTLNAIIHIEGLTVATLNVTKRKKEVQKDKVESVPVDQMSANGASPGAGSGTAIEARQVSTVGEKTKHGSEAKVDKATVKVRVLRPTACFVDFETRMHLTSRRVEHFYAKTTGPEVKTLKDSQPLVNKNAGFRTPEDFYFRRFPEVWATTILSFLILATDKGFVQMEVSETEYVDVGEVFKFREPPDKDNTDSVFETIALRVFDSYRTIIDKVCQVTISRIKVAVADYPSYKSFVESLGVSCQGDGEKDLVSSIKLALYHRILDEIKWDVMTSTWFTELPEDPHLGLIDGIEKKLFGHFGEAVLFGGVE
ncbi:MAG: Flp pilus assembly complex ATPase component TadA [Armatimonadetes bacterium]|nr:Flp pilus assembly complex ATPase component TadA [Armatimonadota bacterium]